MIYSAQACVVGGYGTRTSHVSSITDISELQTERQFLIVECYNLI